MLDSIHAFGSSKNIDLDLVEEELMTVSLIIDEKGQKREDELNFIFWTHIMNWIRMNSRS